MVYNTNDQERFCSTPNNNKLPLFSYRAYETPGLATPPVNIAGSVPFLWEEAPGKPRSFVKKPSGCLKLPPATTIEPSPTTVLDGPYELQRRSLSLPRSSSVIRKLRGVPGPAPEKEKRMFGGSSRWGGFGKCKDVSEGIFDFSRCDCRRDWAGGGDDGTIVNLLRFRKKGNVFNLSHATKSDFWVRVYEGFKQVIPWRRKQENMERIN